MPKKTAKATARNKIKKKVVAKKNKKKTKVISRY